MVSLSCTTARLFGKRIRLRNCIQLDVGCGFRLNQISDNFDQDNDTPCREAFIRESSSICVMVAYLQRGSRQRALCPNERQHITHNKQMRTNRPPLCPDPRDQALASIHKPWASCNEGTCWSATSSLERRARRHALLATRSSTGMPRMAAAFTTTTKSGHIGYSDVLAGEAQ